MSREIEPIRNVASLKDARNSLLAWVKTEHSADKMLDLLHAHTVRLDTSLELAFDALQQTVDTAMRLANAVREVLEADAADELDGTVESLQSVDDAKDRMMFALKAWDAVCGPRAPERPE